MKKAITYAMLFAIPSLFFAQSRENDLTPVETDYLKKSKHQQTAAWILVGGGFALASTSVIMATVKVGEDIVGVFTPGEAPNDYTGESVLFVTGIAAMVASIPLFIASGKNKKRARAMTTNIKMEKAIIFEKQSFVQSSYPAFAFKICL